MSGRRRTVISVVEPDPEMQRQIKNFLNVLLPNAAQIFYSSSIEAIYGMRSLRPDLALIDAQEAEQALTAFPRAQRRFHVIIMARSLNVGLFQKFQGWGADDCCCKPLNELLLKAKIETLMLGLYASPFSFYSEADGADLSSIAMKFRTQIYSLTETAVELVSPVALKAGTCIQVSLGGRDFKVHVESSKANPNRTRSNFIRGSFDAELSPNERAQLRRVIAEGIGAA